MRQKGKCFYQLQSALPNVSNTRKFDLYGLREVLLEKKLSIRLYIYFKCGVGKPTAPTFPGSLGFVFVTSLPKTPDSGMYYLDWIHGNIITALLKQQGEWSQPLRNIRWRILNCQRIKFSSAKKLCQRPQEWKLLLNRRNYLNIGNLCLQMIRRARKRPGWIRLYTAKVI